MSLESPRAHTQGNRGGSEYCNAITVTHKILGYNRAGRVITDYSSLCIDAGRKGSCSASDTNIRLNSATRSWKSAWPLPRKSLPDVVGSTILQPTTAPPELSPVTIVWKSAPKLSVKSVKTPCEWNKVKRPPEYPSVIAYDLARIVDRDQVRRKPL